MPRCKATKANGLSCERIVPASQSYCYSHDPERSVERYRAASKAGRSKSNSELKDVKRQLQEIADKTLKGELDTRRSTAAVQVLQGLIRACEVERRVKELEEVEVALYDLEMRARKGGRPG